MNTPPSAESGIPDIEADVMETAMDIVGIPRSTAQDHAIDIALAIQAAKDGAREQCARITEECEITVPLTPGAADGAAIASKQISAAIRRAPPLNHTETPGEAG